MIRYVDSLNDINIVNASFSNSSRDVDDVYHFNMNFTPGITSQDYYAKVKLYDSNNTEFAYAVLKYEDEKPIINDVPIPMNKTDDGMLFIDCDLYYDDNTSSLMNRTSTEEYPLTYLTVGNKTIITTHFSTEANDSTIINRTADTLPQPAYLGIMIYTKRQYENNEIGTYYICWDVKTKEVTDFMKLPS